MTMKDRLHVTTVFASLAKRRMRRLLALPKRSLGRFRMRVPERLLIAPQDIRTSDPTIAADIVSGYFAFGGKIVNALSRSPFALDSGSDAWTRALTGFGWLRHLRAADDMEARTRGRILVGDFLAAYPRPSPTVAWEPRVAARRIIAWLSQSPIILSGADRTFYSRFLQALAIHHAELSRRLAAGLDGDDRLLAALAIAEFNLCAEGAGTLQRRTTDALAAEIALQVLPDGGHISRNPQVVIDLLLDLLPLRQAYAARGIPAPQPVLNAIDRLMPMLRMFRHGDGTLALFNGMGPTAPELVATILAYDDARAQPVTNAPYAGYQRLEAQRTIVVVDAGPTPPSEFSTRAHAGCLSFELSSGPRRLVVNCGTTEGGRASTVEAARTTAAHSTLVIDDTSSCRFANATRLQRWLGDEIIAGPTTVPVERSDTAAGTVLDLSHDGYAKRFGLIHNRRLTLANDGARLEGLDRLTPSSKTPVASVPFALRFHLHPAVRAQAGETARELHLALPDGEIWRFDSEADAVVEASILFAAPGGPRPTTQIVVRSDTREHGEIGWAFVRIAEGDRRR